MDSEITTKILRQIRDEIIATRTELKTELGELRTDLKAEIAVTNERLTVVEHVVEDAAKQITEYVRHQKTKQDGAIEDLRRRVTRLEKKQG